MTAKNIIGSIYECSISTKKEKLIVKDIKFSFTSGSYELQGDNKVYKGGLLIIEPALPNQMQLSINTDYLIRCENGLNYVFSVSNFGASIDHHEDHTVIKLNKLYEI